MNSHLVKKVIENEPAMLALGAKLAHACPDTAVIFLYGDLGAGKTTLTRGFMRGFGFQDAVKSPTYTLVEPYEINGQKIFHFDFYRVRDADELEFIGIKDYFIPKAICLVEWPDMGADMLPPADVSCYIEPCSVGRKIKLEAHSEVGKHILKQLG